MVDINRAQIIKRYRQLCNEIRSLENILWESIDPNEQVESTRWNINSLLARIDEIDTELVEIERLLPDVGPRSNEIKNTEDYSGS